MTIMEKILIIDDSQFDCRILSEILSPEYEVACAENGEDGIMLARQLRPSLILLDVILPSIDGFEVISRLKCHESTRQTPVIFITGVHGSYYEEKGFKMGAVDYVRKPFKANIVSARVKNHVNLYAYSRAMEEIALRDNLTGMFNRRAWDVKLHAAWEKAKKLKKNLSVLMADVDCFKQYNDTYGHLAGDHVLKLVADVMGGCFSSHNDFVARYGGEEFCAVFFGSTQSRSMRLAEKVRARVEDMRIPHATSVVAPYVTLSLGGHTMIPTDEETEERFVRCADEALYLSKQSGRNRLLWR